MQWRVRPRNWCGHLVCSHGHVQFDIVDEREMVVVSRTLHGGNVAEVAALMDLIAALPDLLVACEAARLALRATSRAAKDYTHELALLNAALAKAKGEPRGDG